MCFGGIYFRKPVAAIAGFINGLFLGGIVLVIMMLTYNDVGADLVIVLGIALIVAGICVAFDKFFAAISAFVSSLLTLIIIALLLTAAGSYVQIKEIKKQEKMKKRLKKKRLLAVKLIQF